MAVVLPQGAVFRITRQLRMVEHGMPPALREYGFQLVGAPGPSPPLIRVQDSADLSGFPLVACGACSATVRGVTYEPRPALLWALYVTPGGGNDAPSLYSAMLRGVDVDMGDNMALSAVSMDGAQLCSLEDISIRGRNFTAGVVGLPGSGGFATNIHVTGGAFAVWQFTFRPNPSVAGLVAEGQGQAAVLLGVSRGPLVLSGFVIRSAAQGFRGVVAYAPPLPPAGFGGKDGDSAIALEDGLVDLSGSQDGTAAAIANDAGRDVSLHNVWIRAGVAVSVGTAASAGGVRRFPSSASSFRRITAWSLSRQGSIAFSAGANASAQATGAGLPPLDGLPDQPPATPPPDAGLAGAHSWPKADADASAWGPSALDVWRDCGATPAWVNPSDDDGAAISTCLARAAAAGPAVVFVPRGDYQIAAPLALPPGARLVGAGKHSASLVMAPGPAFGSGKPLLSVSAADAGKQGVWVSDLVLVQTQRAGLLGVSGPVAALRDVRTVPCSLRPSSNQPNCTSPPPDAPGPAGEAVAAVRFEGSASGRFYGLSLDHFATFLTQPQDALVLANGTAGAGVGVHLYQLSAEHLPAAYQVQAWRSDNFHLHAFKYESAGLDPAWHELPGAGLLACHTTANVSVFGGSGNYGIQNATLARDIVFAWGCPGLRLDAMVRKPTTGE
eukprot:gene3209-3731_t